MQRKLTPEEEKQLKAAEEALGQKLQTRAGDKLNSKQLAWVQENRVKRRQQYEQSQPQKREDFEEQREERRGSFLSGGESSPPPDSKESGKDDEGGDNRGMVDILRDIHETLSQLVDRFDEATK